LWMILLRVGKLLEHILQVVRVTASRTTRGDGCDEPLHLCNRTPPIYDSIRVTRIRAGCDKDILDQIFRGPFNA
jgi:hypothetical protein